MLQLQEMCVKHNSKANQIIICVLICTVCPRVKEAEQEFVVFLISARNHFPLSRGSINLVFKKAIVAPSRPVAADSFVLNQFALRAPSAGFQRA